MANTFAVLITLKLTAPLVLIVKLLLLPTFKVSYAVIAPPVVLLLCSVNALWNVLSTEVSYVNVPVPEVLSPITIAAK